jgi:hypothetical protein
MNYRHGGAFRGKMMPEYRVWTDMKSRCSNSQHHAYRNYGGRGIEVCARWKESF